MDAAVSPRDRAGRTVLERAEALGRHSDSPEHYTRTLFTPAHLAAGRQLAQWMREAGMVVRVDSVGNGGKYDGVLGILLGIGAVSELNRRGERLPVAIEVAGFSDEEGARF